ncbi:MAG: glycosyltransferase [bacterium]
MKKPNLSILINTLSQGGAERVVSTFLPMLVKDYNVTLCLCYDIISYPIPKEVKTVVLTNGRIKTNPIRKITDLILIRKKYLKFLKTSNIEYSISFLALSNIINGLANKKLSNIKTIISERCYPSLMYKSSRATWFIANYIMPKYYNANDILFSNSIEINKDLSNNFGVDIPMEVIYNPIVISKFRKEYVDTNSDKFSLVNIGTIYFAKNQKLILETINYRANKSIELTVYGDGPQQKELVNYADEYNITDQIKFAGRIKNVTERLIEHDCFILSSNNEGFPNVLLEAMSVGLACISTNCLSGPLELLNDNKPLKINQGEFAFAKYGLMINVGDKIGLSKAISYYKENPTKLKEFGLLAYNRAKDFEVEKIYHQLKNLIEN